MRLDLAQLPQNGLARSHCDGKSVWGRLGQGGLGLMLYLDLALETGVAGLGATRDADHDGSVRGRG